MWQDDEGKHMQLNHTHMWRLFTIHHILKFSTDQERFSIPAFMEADEREVGDLSEEEEGSDDIVIHDEIMVKKALQFWPSVLNGQCRVYHVRGTTGHRCMECAHFHHEFQPGDVDANSTDAILLAAHRQVKIDRSRIVTAAVLDGMEKIGHKVCSSLLKCAEVCLHIHNRFAQWKSVAGLSQIIEMDDFAADICHTRTSVERKAVNKMLCVMYLPVKSTLLCIGIGKLDSVGTDHCFRIADKCVVRGPLMMGMIVWSGNLHLVTGIRVSNTTGKPAISRLLRSPFLHVEFHSVTRNFHSMRGSTISLDLWSAPGQLPALANGQHILPLTKGAVSCEQCPLQTPFFPRMVGWPPRTSRLTLGTTIAMLLMSSVLRGVTQMIDMIPTWFSVQLQMGGCLIGQMPGMQDHEHKPAAESREERISKGHLTLKLRSS
jgi:hypothetical protein